MKTIWKRSNPFKKKVEKTPDEEIVQTEEQVPKVAEVQSNNEDERFGKAELVIQNASIVINDPIVKLDINIRNKGAGIARDVKLKILASPLLRPLTSPMVSLGDMMSGDKKQTLVQFEMSQKFVDEYTNFSLLCDSSDSKTASLVCTCKTGRRPLTASEILEKKEEEARRKLGKPTDKKKR